MKSKEEKSKRTYTPSEMNLLVLKESFERDLPLFVKLVQGSESFFGEKIVQRDWTFTVVKDQRTGERELFINVPAKKK